VTHPNAVEVDIPPGEYNTFVRGMKKWCWDNAPTAHLGASYSYAQIGDQFWRPPYKQVWYIPDDEERLLFILRWK